MIRSVSNVSLPHRSSAGSIRTSFSVKDIDHRAFRDPLYYQSVPAVLFSAVPNLPPRRSHRICRSGRPGCDLMSSRCRDLGARERTGHPYNPGCRTQRVCPGACHNRTTASLLSRLPLCIPCKVSQGGQRSGQSGHSGQWSSIFPQQPCILISQFFSYYNDMTFPAERGAFHQRHYAADPLRTAAVYAMPNRQRMGSCRSDGSHLAA